MIKDVLLIASQLYPNGFAPQIHQKRANAYQNAKMDFYLKEKHVMQDQTQRLTDVQMIAKGSSKIGNVKEETRIALQTVYKHLSQQLQQQW